jgi:hypothetical protein
MLMTDDALLDFICVLVSERTATGLALVCQLDSPPP